MSELPRYATLMYDVRKALDITWTEYVYLDMVYHLSHDGWCYKSLDNVGEDLGLDRSNVYRMRNRLIERGLLKKNARGHVKTTDAYAKRIRTDEGAYAKRDKPYAKRDSAVVKTHTKNNNRTTENMGASARDVLERMYGRRRTVLPEYVVDERTRESGR